MILSNSERRTTVNNLQFAPFSSGCRRKIQPHQLKGLLSKIRRFFQLLLTWTLDKCHTPSQFLACLTSLVGHLLTLTVACPLIISAPSWMRTRRGYGPINVHRFFCNMGHSEVFNKDAPVLPFDSMRVTSVCLVLISYVNIHGTFKISFHPRAQIPKPHVEFIFLLFFSSPFLHRGSRFSILLPTVSQLGRHDRR